MLQKRWSRRINYDVLNSLFPGGNGPQPSSSKNTTTTDAAPTAEEVSEDDEDSDEDLDEDEPNAKRARNDPNDWRSLGGLPPAPAEAEYEDEEAEDYWE